MFIFGFLNISIILPFRLLFATSLILVIIIFYIFLLDSLLISKRFFRLIIYLEKEMSVVNVKVAFIRPEYQNLKEWMQDDKNVYIGRKGIVFVDGKRFPNECS